ncbi:DUF86 domain-containing protein [Phormidium pseudopriestleyi FRX01]|uniref:DUF86 domain-containing protein n=1 Tax=Phormidium pseudopriestleyi FRX01 TaxID=1759528 RepID=A0ABS3FQJ4_9CYAN|nr:DUF86 domain-containing protein [Phormidium pseudopriestleyi]MBO0349387.1 DUF86 domain-containing protein [Phormidium pseudopriestleyi FRX01]
MDPLLVGRRLELIAKYLETLREFQSVTRYDFLNTFRDQVAVERLLELMIQSALDINKHILVSRYQVHPKTNESCFLEAGRNGIISTELAQKISRSAKMRNILAHKYEDIDPEVVYTAISKALQQYPLYIRQVSDYLNSLEVDNG